MPTITTTGLTGYIHGSRSESFKRANAHLLSPSGQVVGQLLRPADKVPVMPAHKPAKRLRQKDGDGLNKLERRFKEWHEANFRSRPLLVQAITLRIANGCRYSPDFVTVVERALPLDTNPAFQLFAYEVKGPHAWDDAIVKLKVAASLYPFIGFTLVSWDKTASVWRMETVKP